MGDSTQEVFMVVHRKLNTFETGSIRAWLYAICLRVASEYRRRAHVRREVVESDPVGDASDRGPSPATEAERAQAFGMLNVALDALPLEQRAVFSAFELEEMTCNEIAEAFEMPLGTVYSRLRLARESFARTIGRLTARDRRLHGLTSL